MNFLNRGLNQKNTPIDLLNSMMNQFMQTTMDDSTSGTTLWSPSVDIKEDRSKYTVMADLPGVEDKDLSVTLENNILCIKGERHFESKEKEEGFSRTERFEGQFYRRFTLPEAIEGSKIQADYKKGVLHITIPKREAAQAKKIEIKHSN